MTADPLANIPALDLDDLADAAEWAAECAQPFDDCPTFDRSADPEVDPTAALSADRVYVHTASRHLYRDYRAQPDAYKHIEYLPRPGETLDMLISGRYAMWDLVPALIERTGQPIDVLTVATLSYSKTNAAELLGLMDAGHVKRVNLLVSYFFKAQNRTIYDALVPQLLERGQKVLAMRTHAKIILAGLDDGTRHVIRGSPNLRSCKNVEQLTWTNDGGLYDFYASWIVGELIAERDERTSRQRG